MVPSNKVQRRSLGGNLVLTCYLKNMDPFHNIVNIQWFDGNTGEEILHKTPGNEEWVDVVDRSTTQTSFYHFFLFLVSIHVLYHLVVLNCLIIFEPLSTPPSPRPSHQPSQESLHRQERRTTQQVVHKEDSRKTRWYLHMPGRNIWKY